MRLQLLDIVEGIGAAEAARRLHWKATEMLDMVAGRVEVPPALARRIAALRGEAPEVEARPGWPQAMHPDLARLMALEGWATIAHAAAGLGYSTGYIRMQRAAPSWKVALRIREMLAKHVKQKEGSG
jgi:AraC-like DNA-binding protein